MQNLLTRRQTLVLLGAGAVAVLGSRLSPARAQSGGDVAFVRQLSDKLIGIVNSSSSLTAKRQQILPLIDDYVDVNGIGRFCLGRYWRIASPEQQQRFLELFHHVLSNAITDKIGQYEGVRIEVGTSEPHGPGLEAVNATISRPGQPPANVQWVIAHVNGAPKVSDIIGEGVSLSITQRGDYTSYLQRNNNNIEALLKALERQAARQA